MIVLVFSGEATLYSIRTRKRIWASRPSAWVIFSTVGDICIVSILATLGFVLSPISVFVVIGTLGVSIVFAFVLDTVKVPLFRRLKIT
jgi:H+-transporting ATPase